MLLTVYIARETKKICACEERYDVPGSWLAVGLDKMIIYLKKIIKYIFINKY